MRILCICLSILLGILIRSAIYAQDLDIDHINYADGFSNSQISTLSEDQYGFIWAGTNGGGLYRWDGMTLKSANEALRYETILGFLIDTLDEKLVSTYDEIFKLDYKNDIVATLKLRSSLYYPNDIITGLFRFEDKIIAFSNFGLAFVIDAFSLQIKQKLLVAEEFYNYSVVQTDNSFTLFNTSSAVTLKLNSDTLTTSKEKIKIATKLYNNEEEFTDQHFKRGLVSNEVIFLQSDDSLYQFNNGFQLENKYRFNSDETIYCLKKVKDFWWIGTASGLYHYKVHNGELIQGKKLLDKQIWSILDTKDHVWAGSIVGLFSIATPKIRLLSQKEFEGANYVDFEAIDNTTWALSLEQGIHVYKDESIIDTIELKQDLPILFRVIKKFHNDSVYIGSSKGLLKLNIRTKEIFPVKELPYSIFSIENQEDTIIISTLGLGIFKKLNGTYKNYLALNDSVMVRFVAETATYRDNTFIASENGLFCLNGGEMRRIDLLTDSIENAKVTSLLVNNGKLLVGTKGHGIFILDIARDERMEKVLNAGLSSNSINSLKEIDDAIWVGTALGVDIMQIKSDSIIINNLSNLSAVAGAETILKAIQVVGQNVWVSTIAGLISVPRNVLSLAKEQESNQIIIESLSYGIENRKTYFPNPSGIHQILEIPYSEGELSISFNSVNFSDIKKKYRYKLTGYDSEITKGSDLKTTIYKKLPPGEYTFEVWEENSFNDNISKETIGIHVIPPFYMTLIFKIVIIILVVFIMFYGIYSYSKLKNQRFLAREKDREEARDVLRNEIAMDFHDEMGNHLAKIINLSGVLKMQNVPDKFLPVVSKIEENAKKLFSSTSDLIWSLKSQNNNTEEIFFLIKDFTQKLFEQSDVDVRFFNSLNQNSVALNAKRSRDITLVIKEIVTNIYKHAHAKNTTITFEADNQLKIRIEDDGVGFNRGNDSINGGLTNMRQRAKRSDIAIDIQSKVGDDSGTVFTLTVK